MQSGQFFWIFSVLIFFVGLLYFSTRRNKVALQSMQQMADSLAVGDQVLTTVGIVGIILEVRDDLVLLKIADNIEIQWAKLGIKEKINFNK